MRKLTIALSVASLALAGAAAAQPSDEHGLRGPRDAAHEPATRAAVEEHADSLFARLDVNGDGVLDPSDRESRRESRTAEHFSRADADGNGQLSLEEVTAAREARRDGFRERREAMKERAGEHMAMRDGEGPKHRMRGPGRGEMLRGIGMMARTADADDNGAITAAEFKAAALAHFDRVDTNGDGSISAEERKAAREAHRPGRDRRGA